MDLASLGVSFGASKFPYNEEIHFRSSIFESHDDTAEGILILSLCALWFFWSSFVCMTSSGTFLGSIMVIPFYDKS